MDRPDYPGGSRLKEWKDRISKLSEDGPMPFLEFCFRTSCMWWLLAGMAYGLAVVLTMATWAGVSKLVKPQETIEFSWFTASFLPGVFRSWSTATVFLMSVFFGGFVIVGVRSKILIADWDSTYRLRSGRAFLLASAVGVGLGVIGALCHMFGVLRTVYYPFYLFVLVGVAAVFGLAMVFHTVGQATRRSTTSILRLLAAPLGIAVVIAAVYGAYAFQTRLRYLPSWRGYMDFIENQKGDQP